VVSYQKVKNLALDKTIYEFDTTKFDLAYKAYTWNYTIDDIIPEK
jgi:hypothetical protein